MEKLTLQILIVMSSTHLMVLCRTETGRRCLSADRRLAGIKLIAWRSKPFFEGTYLKFFLDVMNAGDTLKLSLGADKVVIKGLC